MEQQIRNAPVSHSPSHAQVLRKTRLKLRDLYYAILLADFEYATSKEVELYLWKSCFYKPANDYRTACKKVSFCSFFAFRFFAPFFPLLSLFYYFYFYYSSIRFCSVRCLLFSSLILTVRPIAT
jgi:hypothetical protein